jgi:hypothetical protein
MSIHGLIVAIVLLTLLRDASADTVVVGTPGQIGAAYFGAAVGRSLAAGIDFANTKAQANAQIAAERRRFFAEYPNGRNFAQAEKEFAASLWAKDLYFMSISLPTGFRDSSPDSMASVMGKLDRVTGGALDNGIPNAAAFTFDRWVTAIRGHLGATSYRAPLRRLPSTSELLAALDATKDVYTRYKKDRDEAEFEMQCRARPGPYCAIPGGYSHGGATARAARIADYYLAHYAQALPGGDAMKTKVRDAIIKFESLAYTTQDCIRYVDRSFANDPRHDPNLAALRAAIARYESVKVMSQEDICIRAAQDMQRDEAVRNGTPRVTPTAKELWDTNFRTSKLNELYGPLTSDQAGEVAQAMGGKPKDYETRATVIDFYTGSREARAARVRIYHVVRHQVIQRASGVQPPARASADAEPAVKRDPGSTPHAAVTAPGADALYVEGTKAYSSQDHSRARALWEQACDGGNATSCADLGIMVGSGRGGPPDKARARALLEKACNGGSKVGCAHLAAVSQKEGSPRTRRGAPPRDPGVVTAPAVPANPSRAASNQGEGSRAYDSNDYVRARRQAPPSPTAKASPVDPQPHKRCTLDELAGTYRTSYGPLVCKRAAGDMQCCYGNLCERTVALAFDDTGRNLVGSWRYPNGTHGPVTFPVSPECLLESGRWSPAGRAPDRIWPVRGRE